MSVLVSNYLIFVLPPERMNVVGKPWQLLWYWGIFMKIHVYWLEINIRNFEIKFLGNDCYNYLGCGQIWLSHIRWTYIYAGIFK